MTPPTQERESAPTGRSERPLNWGWIALGGCFVLALILLLNPISLMVIGMSIESIRQDRESDRRQAQEATAEAAAVVCRDPPPGVLARIEAALRRPYFRLRGVRAVRSILYPSLWVIAADVERADLEVDDFDAEGDFAVWSLWQHTPDDASPGPDDEITSGNGLAAGVSSFPSSFLGNRLNELAIGCTASALSGA